MVILAAGQLCGPDYFILVAYFMLMLGIGVYFYRYMRNMKDYFVGSNQVNWWLSGVSLYMSGFSVFGFIAYSSLAFKYGLVAVTIWWTGLPAMIICILFFARKWRRIRVNSPVEYLENRYSLTIRQMFAWQGIPVKIIDDALKLVAIGIFIKEAFGISYNQGMLSSGLIMLAYTVMGGLWAVVVTDFIQFVVMAVGVVVLVPLALNAAGGVSNFLNHSPQGFFNVFHPPEYTWVYIILCIIMSIMSTATHWSFIQRFYCVPKEKDVVKLGILVLLMKFIGAPLIILPAMAARHFLAGDIDSSQVYPLLCMKLLPVGLIGLIVAAMFSATMSMLSSDYNVCASVLTNDVYRRMIRPNASDKELVFVGRLATIAIGLFAMAVAWYMGAGKDESLFRNMMKLFSIATAPVAVPMLLGLFFKRITSMGALMGFLFGVTAGLIVFLCHKYGVIDEAAIKMKIENLLFMITTVTTFVVILLVSFVAPEKPAEHKRIESFLLRLKIPIGQMDGDALPGSGKSKIAFSPVSIVGVSIIFIGLILVVVLPYIWGKPLEFWLNLSFAVVLIVIGCIMTACGRHKANTKN